MTSKEILAEIGLPNEDPEKLTVEQLRTHRDKTYIGREVVGDDPEIMKKLTGRALGSVQTKIKGVFKEMGVELTPEELKDKPAEEWLDIAKGKTINILTELKTSAGKGNDEKVTKAEKEAEKWQKKNTETEALYNTTKELLTKKEQDFTTELTSYKVKHKIAALKAAIPYSDTVSDYAKKGFDQDFSEKYELELDEDKDALYVKDKKSGQKVKTPDGTANAVFESVYKSELEKAGMLKKNNAGQQQINTYSSNGGAASGNEDKNKFELPAAAREHAERLRAGMS